MAVTNTPHGGGPDRVTLERLLLEQFRVYERLEVSMPHGGIKIIGPNGSGKTSFLEAVLLLSTTRSRRGVLDSDLIREGSGVEYGVAPYARVSGDFSYRHGNRAHLEIYIERDNARGTSKKLIRVGDSPRRAMDVIGLVPSVGFSPDDMELVTGSPGNRRRFLDVVLSQVDPQYVRHLSRYSRMISHRNGLLRQSGSSNGVDRGQFAYWDEQIIALGAYILAARQTATNHMSLIANDFFSRLAPAAGELELRYSSTLEQPNQWWDSVAEYGARGIESAAQMVGVAFERSVQACFTQDLQRGATQIGPHRDDVEFTLNGRDISRFGSRGQQRLAVVATKLAEILFIRDQAAIVPIMLLDDVLSELDPIHRETLLSTVAEQGSQVLVTATEASLLADADLPDMSTIELKGPGIVG